MPTLRWFRLPGIRRDRYFTVWAVSVFVLFAFYARYENKHEHDEIILRESVSEMQANEIRDPDNTRYPENKSGISDVRELIASRDDKDLILSRQEEKPVVMETDLHPESGHKNVSKGPGERINSSMIQSYLGQQGEPTNYT